MCISEQILHFQSAFQIDALMKQWPNKLQITSEHMKDHIPVFELWRKI